MVYLDYAATAYRRPDSVIDAVAAAMRSSGNVGRGSHSAALDASRTVYTARERIASLFSFAYPERVVFTQNSTMALNIVLRGLFQPGEHIISTVLEHNSVLRPLHDLAECGIESSLVPADSCGQLDYHAFFTLLRPETRAVVCTMASNLTGDMPDFSFLRSFCREHGLLLIADASQTAGCQPVSAEGIDVLCFTGHKGLLGPQGTGGMCIAPGVEIRPLFSGGTGVQTYLPMQPEQYPTRLEAGTLNSHGIAGLSAAAQFILETGAENIHRHNLELAQRFYEGVHDITGVRVYGDWSGNDRSAIVTLNISDCDSSETADLLQERYDICVRAGAHCAPLAHRALGTEEQGAVRFSFGWFNTPEETDFAIQAVKELAEDA